MATYTITLTDKAVHSWGSTDPSKMLIDAHRAFDPDLSPSSIKVIKHYLSSNGGVLGVGGTDLNERNHRYIRVVIDVVASEKVATAAGKEKLLKGTVEARLGYEGAKAKDTEIEDVLNVFERENVMVHRARPAVRRVPAS